MAAAPDARRSSSTRRSGTSPTSRRSSSPSGWPRSRRPASTTSSSRTAAPRASRPRSSSPGSRGTARGEPERNHRSCRARWPTTASATASLSATGIPPLKEGFGPLAEGFVHLTAPYPLRVPDCTNTCVAELEETIERIGAGRIAAMIGEPVLGRRRDDPAARRLLAAHLGGAPRARHPADPRRDRDRLRAHGKLVRRRALGRHPRRPDRHRQGTDQRLRPDGRRPDRRPRDGAPRRRPASRTASPTTAIPTGAAVALRQPRRSSSARACASGPSSRAGGCSSALREAEGLPAVAEVRGVGLMAGVELEPSPPTAPSWPAASAAAGAIVRATGQKLVLSPPLVIEADQVDRLAEIIVLRAGGHGGAGVTPVRDTARATAPPINQSVERAARSCSYFTVDEPELTLAQITARLGRQQGDDPPLRDGASPRRPAPLRPGPGRLHARPAHRRARDLGPGRPAHHQGRRAVHGAAASTR